MTDDLLQPYPPARKRTAILRDGMRLERTAWNPNNTPAVDPNSTARANLPLYNRDPFRNGDYELPPCGVRLDDYYVFLALQ